MSQQSVISPSTKEKNDSSRNCMARFLGLCRRGGNLVAIQDFVKENADFIDINGDDPITNVIENYICCYFFILRFF